MVDESENKRKIPTGTAPKGGTRFPRYGLKEAIAWSTKLVSKTHSGPQPADIVYASVVGSKGPRGQIKAATLKQYDLMSGDTKAYSATDLAKAIATSPTEELPPLYARAALSPAIFKALFDTYSGVETSVGKLRQRAAELNVHPDNIAECVKVYTASLLLAGLINLEGDRVVHVSTTPTGAASEVPNGPEVIDEELKTADASTAAETGVVRSEEDPDEVPLSTGGAPRAVFQVNVNLDSSLDTEKLEKQLALLKRFGAI